MDCRNKKINIILLVINIMKTMRPGIFIQMTFQTSISVKQLLSILLLWRWPLTLLYRLLILVRSCPNLFRLVCFHYIYSEYCQFICPKTGNCVIV